MSTKTEGEAVRLVVRNGGARIDPQVAQTLTEPFRRLDRSYGGFGLGLSIVRSVAEVHGGTVELVAPERAASRVRLFAGDADGRPRRSGARWAGANEELTKSSVGLTQT